MVKQHTGGIVPKAGLCPWSSSSWLGRAGQECQRLQALLKGLPGVMPPMGMGQGDRGVGKTVLLRPHLNAVSLKASFLSSEGTGPSPGSTQHNVVLCPMLNSLCL